jgi:signal transduction histidine kinase
VNELAERPASEGARVAWQRWVRWLVPLIYFGVFVAFVADIFVEVFFIPFGILYIPLVCTAVFHRNQRSAWWLAGLACTMAVLGFFFPIINPHPTHGIVLRLISIAAILVTAALVRYARVIQQKLAEQTSRAEAAERVKTEVFLTLSQEMRTPLHAMVGLTEVMVADCRPDQRGALQQVQGSSRRLLATIENLIDLTHLGERPIANQAVDVNRMIRQAADASRQMASERQIAVELALPNMVLTAHGDPWAVRRILDNLIANAVKFSPAGSTVELTAEQHPHSVTLLVRDAGIGMSAEILRRLGEPYFQEAGTSPLTGTGTGLALSRRLASAMGAVLAFDSELGCGTTATLELPA